MDQDYKPSAGEHPITLPPELVQQWHVEALTGFRTNGIYEQDIATLAAQWGADQELEACLDEIYKGVGLRIIDHGSHRELLCSDLRAARRPKPQTLSSIALQMLGTIERDAHYLPEITDTIRRALEALND
jgi:hypothetical protein